MKLKRIVQELTHRVTGFGAFIHIHEPVMLPSSPETLFHTAVSGGTIIHRHEPHQFESSACARPQMAWQMYEQLLRIANKQKQHEHQSNQGDDEKQTDTKRLWLAAFTGPSLSYRPGVAAGAAEPL